MSEERLLLWTYVIFSAWAGLGYLRRRHVFGTRFLASILLVAALSAAGIAWPEYRHEAFLAATTGFVLFLLLPGVFMMLVGFQFISLGLLGEMLLRLSRGQKYTIKERAYREGRE